MKACNSKCSRKVPEYISVTISLIYAKGATEDFFYLTTNQHYHNM
jgi:hypothetical protein